MSVLRIGCLDGEMSNLQADYGILLCLCIQEDGVDKTHTLRLDDSPDYKRRPWDDSHLCRQVYDLISQFDILFTWNGSRFDIPFINTRLVQAGLPPLPKKLHKDLLYTSRFKLRLASNRLDAVQDFFGLPTEKSRITPAYWTKALTGDREAMDYIVDHCERDVKVTMQVLEKLKPFVSAIFA